MALVTESAIAHNTNLRVNLVLLNLALINFIDLFSRKKRKLFDQIDPQLISKLHPTQQIEMTVLF